MNTELSPANPARNVANPAALGKGLGLPLRYRLALSGPSRGSGANAVRARQDALHTAVGKPWSMALHRPLAGIAFMIWAVSAAFIGLYLGVTCGVAQMALGYEAGADAPMQLMEGFFRMLLGWMIFIAFGLLSARAYAKMADPGRSRATSRDSRLHEKEHVLGYD